MAQQLRILHVEESEQDAAQVVSELNDCGYHVEQGRVWCRTGLEAALNNGYAGWDLVLSEIELPQIDALTVLRIIAESPSDAPLIILARESDPEVAANLMRRGAVELVLKGNLRRLTQVVARELDERVKRQSRADDLRRDRERLRLLSYAFDLATDGIMLTDLKPAILSVNARASQISGFSEAELVGQDPRVFKSYCHNPLFFEQMWLTLLQNGRWQGEIWNRRKNGEVYPVDMTITAVEDSSGQPSHYIAVFNDITEQKQTETRIRELAYFDALTTLPNVRHLRGRLPKLLDQARRDERSVLLLLVDLDRLQAVNDSLGYGAGDELLKLLAERLSKLDVGSEGIVARLGGDQFGVVVPDLPRGDEATQHAQWLGDTARKLVSEPATLSGHELTVTASAGLALFPRDAVNADELINNAGAARDRAKTRRDCWQMYTTAMNRSARDRLILEGQLRKAIANGDFVLHYQPRVDANDLETLGVEALVRWQFSPDRLIMPGHFIGIAEESRLIVPLGEWVLRAACKQAVAWAAQGLKPTRISVNVSPQQLREGKFDQTVAEVLAETGLDPALLELEITESSLEGSVEKIKAVLNQLVSMGLTISVDDFGTGYSSLSSLKQFPIRTVKIDRSFVSGLPADVDDVAIATAVVAMGHSLGLNVVAEGVENTEQLAFLTDLGCDEAQGYLFSRPVEPAHIADRLSLE